jgi:hypothetical protein
MEEKPNGKSLEEQYPSVDLAYEFVKSSYDWMLNRIEAMNNKIQGLLTLATTITAAMPILAKAMFTNVSFQSVWFAVAMVIYILLVIVGIIGVSTGTVRLIHPMNLYEKWLSDSPFDFKKDTIYFSGQDFEDNKKALEVKSLLRTIMNILLLGELLMLIYWIYVASRII